MSSVPSTLVARISEARSRALGYLLARRSSRGGFCFYKSAGTDHPNLADTWHAVHALSRLGYPVSDRKVISEFVLHFASSQQPAHLFYVTSTIATLYPEESALASCLRGAIDALAVEPATPGDLPRGSLERMRHLARLRRLTGDTDALARIAGRVGDFVNHSPFATRPDLWITWVAIDTLDVCGRIDLVSSATRTFLNDVQIGPTGFTGTRDSRNPSLNIVFAGLASCRLLKIPVRFLTAATTFVLGCQAPNGGFRVSPGGLTNIETTDCALDALHFIAEAMSGLLAKRR